MKAAIGNSEIFLLGREGSGGFSRFIRLLSNEDQERFAIQYPSYYSEEDGVIRDEVNTRTRALERAVWDKPTFTVGRTGKLYFHRKIDGEPSGKPEVPYKLLRELFNPHIEVDLPKAVDRISGEPDSETCPRNTEDKAEPRSRVPRRRA